MAMKKRDATDVIREALMKRLRFDDSTVRVVTRQPAVGGEATLRLPNGTAIRLVWTATGRLAHRFDFTSPSEPILYMEVPAAVASLAELQPQFEALTPALAAELRAHATHGHLTIVGGVREQPLAGCPQSFSGSFMKSAAIVALFIVIIVALIGAL
jgi:hypothetical protein